MAAPSPVKELCEEATCPICLDYFNDPVIIPECGHNFCRGCLAQCWGEVEASCPLCKETVQPRSLGPNRQLANVVEIAKKLSLQGRKGGEVTKEEAKERICATHQEPLKLFCQTDENLICVVCDRSKEHKNHEVIPAGEAFEEYKDKIFKYLETLKTEREKILARLAEVKNGSQQMLKITKSEKQKTEAEFRKLHQLLKEQEDRLLAQVGEVEKEIVRKRDEHLARLSEEVSSLESLIQEMEEKHHQPVNEFLQDVRSTLQRCEQKEPFENPVAFPPELKWTLQGCCDIGPCLGFFREKFKDTLISVPPQMQKAANVTLDSTSATHKVIISEDRRSIEYQRDAVALFQINCTLGFVWGREKFTGGCHFWEVSVGNEGGWAVGVAKTSVDLVNITVECGYLFTKALRGLSTFTPENGFWLVGRMWGQYKAFIEGSNPPLSLSGELKKVRVCLDYDRGRVAFFDADAATLLYAFSGVPFSGQTLCPLFALWDKGHLRLSS